jgi:hypothetical protein
MQAAGDDSMRVLIALILAATAVPAPSATLKQQPPACPRASSYLASKTGDYRGAPLKPRKLTELPPAIGYMAVYRTINGCDAPLTMVEYRNTRRR